MSGRSFLRAWDYLRFLPLLLGVLLLGANDLTRRPGVDPEQVLIEPSNLPTQLGSGAGAISGIDWQQGAYTPISSEDVSWRLHWTAGETYANDAPMGSPELTELFVRYSAPAMAAWYFQQASPARVYTFPVLAGSQAGTRPERVSLPYRSRDAAQQRVVCAVGGISACQVWYAWLRYGQYIVQVRLISIDQPITPGMFAELLVVIDGLVAEYFARVVEEYSGSSPVALTITYGPGLIFYALLSFGSLWHVWLGSRMFGRFWHWNWTEPAEQQRLPGQCRAMRRAVFARLCAALGDPATQCAGCLRVEMAGVPVPVRDEHRGLAWRRVADRAAWCAAYAYCIRWLIHISQSAGPGRGKICIVSVAILLLAGSRSVFKMPIAFSLVASRITAIVRSRQAPLLERIRDECSAHHSCDQPSVLQPASPGPHYPSTHCHRACSEPSRPGRHPLMSRARQLAYLVARIKATFRPHPRRDRAERIQTLNEPVATGATWTAFVEPEQHRHIF
jgi:hypothetical protein